MQKNGAGISFYVFPQKYQSEFIYDTSGSDIEAAVSLLGISTEQLWQAGKGMKSSRRLKFLSLHRLVSSIKRKAFPLFFFN